MARKAGEDLDKISDIVHSFFENKRIVETLEKIGSFGVSGWEKWWQVEFALFLSHADDVIADWDMEHPFETDKRTKLAQSRMALDIGFRLKRQAKDRWYFVELKQADSYRACIDKMIKDADKVFSARKKSFDGLNIKYIACAGVFRKADEEEVLDYVEDELDKAGIDHDGFYFENLAKGYCLLVF
ncbi:MAG: hypothetical protein WCT47_09045 [Betaproteobacteria bacterium]